MATSRFSRFSRFPRFSRCLGACAAALLLAAGAGARAELAAGDPLPLDPQVRAGTLANGLSYYIRNNGKPAKMVELRLVVKAGSVQEDEDQRGLAHVVEHMGFNGSTHFKRHELVSFLESTGVKMGADLNAYTSFERTVYRLSLPSDRPDNLDKGLTVLADWAGGMTLADADIESERKIVLEEMRTRRSPYEAGNKLLWDKRYRGSALATRPPIGDEAVLKGFAPEAVRRFYRDWYRPELMAVVAVGDVDPVALEQQIAARFGQLRNPAAPRAPVYAALPQRGADDSIVGINKNAPGHYLNLYYPPFEAKPETLLGDFRARLVERLFARLLGDRLRELQQQAGAPTTRGTIGVATLPVERFKAFTAELGVGPDGPLPVLEAVVGMTQTVRQQGFSAAELERARMSLLRAVELAYNERDKTDSKRYVDEYVRHFVDHAAAPGIANEYLYARGMLPEITLDELNAYARAVIPSGAPKLLVYGGPPDEARPPVTASLLMNTIRETERAPVRAHDDRKTVASLMASAPAPGSIVAERANPALGTTTLTLSNGVVVILKPTDFSNGRVLLGARRFGGMSRMAPQDALTARYAAPIVQSMGLGTMAPLELQQVMSGRSAGLSALIEPYQEGLNGAAASADLETLLQLTHLRLTTARRDEALFKALVANLSETARIASLQPDTALEAAYQTALYGDNPWAPRPITEAELARLDVDRALALYKARFSSAKGMTFVLVGSFDPQAVRPLLATYLASLPTPDLPLGYRSLGLDPARGVVKTELQAGTIDKSFVRLHFGGKLPVTQDDNLRLQAVVDVMNLRMMATLRGELGMIYSARFSGGFSIVPDAHFSISTKIPTAAANSDKVVAPLMADIRRLQEQGPSAEELAKVKQNWLQVRRAALREDAFWLTQLQGAAVRNAEPLSILGYEKQVEALSADDVKLAARRYFDMSNYVQVTLTPKSKLATFLGL